MKRIGIYPGSFDPITNGHLDIIKRASKLFDEVIVLVAVNNHKNNRFDVNTRVRLIKESIKCFNNVSVDYFNGLTVEYAKMHNAVALIRGIRVSSDFEESSPKNFSLKNLRKSRNSWSSLLFNFTLRRSGF